MKRISILAAFVGVALTVTMTASAVTPVPFPSDKVQQVFVAAQTVTSTGSMAALYAPGSSVVFRAYAVDPKSHKVVDPKMVKYFYVSIPGQPNVKLKYAATAPGASTGLPWSGAWTIPADFATGGVPLQDPDQGPGHARQGVQGPVRADAVGDCRADRHAEPHAAVFACRNGG